MMTLKRFAALAESYGADLARWPDSVRGQAKALMAVSADARARLEEARVLDEAIAAAVAQDDATAWGPGEQEAALARLRSGVEARIAGSARQRAGRRFAGWAPLTGGLVLAFPLRWIGLTTAAASPSWPAC